MALCVKKPSTMKVMISISRCGCSPNPDGQRSLASLCPVHSSYIKYKRRCKLKLLCTNFFFTFEVQVLWLFVFGSVYGNMSPIWPGSRWTQNPLPTMAPRSPCTRSSFITRRTPKAPGPSLYSAKLKWNRDFNQFSLVHPWHKIAESWSDLTSKNFESFDCRSLEFVKKIKPMNRSSPATWCPKDSGHCRTIEDRARWPRIGSSWWPLVTSRWLPGKTSMLWLAKAKKPNMCNVNLGLINPERRFFF